MAFASDQTETAAKPSRDMHRLLFLVAMYAGIQVLRFGSNLVLTRLLAPDILGIMALLTVVMQGLQMLSDTGIGVCIVQSKRGDDPVFLRTAWTIQIIRGFGLWLLAALGAWPAAWFFDDPRLAVYLPVIGAAAAIQGCNSIAIFSMNRRLAMGRVLLLELISYALPLGFTIWAIWALHATSAWPLIAFNLASAALFMALSHTMLPAFAHGLRRDPESVRELTRFGRWIFASTCCSFFAGQADRLLVGKLLAASGLGLYHVAAMVAGLPALLMSCVSAHFLVARYSRLPQDSPDGIAAFLQLHRFGVFAAWAMTAFLFAFGADLVGLLYRGPYLEVVEFLPLLVWINWLQMLQTLGNAWGLAHGKPASLAAANLGKLVALAGFAWLGWHWAGMTGMLLGFLASELARYAITMGLLFRRMPAVWVEHLFATFFLAAAFLTFQSLNGQVTGTTLFIHKTLAAAALLGVTAATSYSLNGAARRRDIDGQPTGDSSRLQEAVLGGMP
jgi:O-antigen/teichoic acid export membrane protein